MSDETPAAEAAPQEPAVIDLDAARAARDFTAKRPVLLRFGGEEFACRPELPVAFVEAIVQERASDAFASLFVNAADLARFMALQPSLEDLTAFAGGVAEHYGVALGNSRRPGG